MEYNEEELEDVREALGIVANDDVGSVLLTPSDIKREQELRNFERMMKGVPR